MDQDISDDGADCRIALKPPTDLIDESVDPWRLFSFLNMVGVNYAENRRGSIGLCQRMGIKLLRCNVKVKGYRSSDAGRCIHSSGVTELGQKGVRIFATIFTLREP
jgi:hypothetical protein